MDTSTRLNDSVHSAWSAWSEHWPDGPGQQTGDPGPDQADGPEERHGPEGHQGDDQGEPAARLLDLVTVAVVVVIVHVAPFRKVCLHLIEVWTMPNGQSARNSEGVFRLIAATLACGGLTVAIVVCHLANGRAPEVLTYSLPVVVGWLCRDVAVRSGAP